MILSAPDFLQAASYFRKVQDETPEKFAAIAKHCGIDRRTAYYWAQQDRMDEASDYRKARQPRKLRGASDHRGDKFGP